MAETIVPDALRVKRMEYATPDVWILKMIVRTAVGYLELRVQNVSHPARCAAVVCKVASADERSGPQRYGLAPKKFDRTRAKDKAEN
jgi:hypothetical protein